MIKKTAAALAALVVLVALAGCGGVSKKKPTDPVEFAATWLTAVINYNKGGNCKDVVMAWMDARGKRLMASDGPGCEGVYHSINPATADWAGVKQGTDATKTGNCHAEGQPTADGTRYVVCFDKISIVVVGPKDDLMSEGYSLQ